MPKLDVRRAYLACQQAFEPRLVQFGDIDVGEVRHHACPQELQIASTGQRQRVKRRLLLDEEDKPLPRHPDDVAGTERKRSAQRSTGEETGSGKNG